jgi:DNA-binding NtrC family response regulator
LRSIQEGEVEPVGARKPVKVDVRLVSATNRDLIADVKQGRFREDLFYRLHVFPITVPPLRARPNDIPALARHFLALFAAEEGKRIRYITPDALGLLTAFPWPGNIRQLENAVFRAVVLAEGDGVGVAEFPQITAQLDAPSAIPQLDPEMAEDTGFGEAPLPADSNVVPKSATDALPLLDAAGSIRPLDELEADIIRYAIAHYRGQMSEVARRLQIGRSTLYRKLEVLGLTGSERREPETKGENVAGERQPPKIVGIGAS